MKDNDTTAFPVQNNGFMEAYGGHPGMTLRDYFAGRALTAIAVLDRVPGEPKHADYYQSVADYAYAVADAMLEAREK